MNGVTSYKGRARRALLHKANSTYWVGVGKQTPWTNEQAPPNPVPGSASIDEPLVYVKPQMVSLCRTVNGDEDFIHYGQRYKYVSDDDALTEDGRFLYILAKLDPTLGIPLGSFRQSAVFTGLIPAVGYEQAQWLSPAHVANPGVLEFIDNDTEEILALNRLKVIEIVLEFR